MMMIVDTSKSDVKAEQISKDLAAIGDEIGVIAVDRIYGIASGFHGGPPFFIPH